MLEFKEQRRPPIVIAAGSEPASQGQSWIDESSGSVERCEMRVEFARLTGSFRFASSPARHISAAWTFASRKPLGLGVPATVSGIDMFWGGQGREAVQISGEATHSNYRRFETGGRVVTGAR